MQRGSRGGRLFDTKAQHDRFVTQYREALRKTAPHAELWGAHAALTVYTRTDSIW